MFHCRVGGDYNRDPKFVNIQRIGDYRIFSFKWDINIIHTDTHTHELQESSWKGDGGNIAIYRVMDVFSQTYLTDGTV